MLSDFNIKTSPEIAAKREMLQRAIASEAGIRPEEINDFKIIRRSIDARQKRVAINLTVRIATGDDQYVPLNIKKTGLQTVSKEDQPVIIVGAGPAGLFAALKALELGLRPIVLERGKDVDSRRLDLAQISRTAKVDADSNYCFGEGGAGAFSDGKLFTRSKKRGNVTEILNLLVEHGAHQTIVIDAHPHIGSDKLPGVIRNIRENIIAHGGEVHFNTRVTELLRDGKSVCGVKTASGEIYKGPVILATGHSARDVYGFLHKQEIPLQSKGLAIGVRLEHPQQLIDRLQYHSPEGRGKYLPAAEYNYVTQSGGRGVYSFCMCPGGVIVPAMSAPGESVVNGMSASARSGKKANSGMVVEVHPGDFPEFAKYGPLEMLELQKSLEKKYFEAAGNTLKAPAQRMDDFVEGKLSETLPDTTYLPGLVSARVDKLMPPFISRRLKEGLKTFGTKCKGFLTGQACLIGLESRTSSPVRIPRQKDTLDHPEVPGLYPCGEGAGLAGGIVSAAIDGQRCAQAVHDYYYKH